MSVGYRTKKPLGLMIQPNETYIFDLKPFDVAREPTTFFENVIANGSEAKVKYDYRALMEKFIDDTFISFEDDSPYVTEGKTRMKQIARQYLQQMVNAVLDHESAEIVNINTKNNSQNNSQNKDLGNSRQPSKQDLLFYDSHQSASKKYSYNTPKSTIVLSQDQDNNPVIIKKLEVRYYSNRLDDFLISLFIILRELTFQTFSYEISHDCGIVVPKIRNVRFFFSNRETFVCEIFMDFIENVDPNEMLSLPEDELQTLRIQLVNALNCLRSYGIFHNDSHSQNIFFTRDLNGDGRLVPYVIDFGKTHSVSSYPTSLGLVDFNLTSGLSEHDMDEYFRRWIKGIHLSREEREKYSTISKSGDTNIIFGGRGKKGILKKSKKSKKRKRKSKKNKNRKTKKRKF